MDQYPVAIRLSKLLSSGIGIHSPGGSFYQVAVRSVRNNWPRVARRKPGIFSVILFAESRANARKLIFQFPGRRNSIKLSSSLRGGSSAEDNVISNFVTSQSSIPCFLVMQTILHHWEDNGLIDRNLHGRERSLPRLSLRESLKYVVEKFDGFQTEKFE